MTGQLINKVINALAEIASSVLAFVWFGWHGLVVVFLILWAANTAYTIRGE